MKKMIVIMILSLFSCKSGKNPSIDQEHENVLLYYSKGPCLGRCPVYDLWVFVDGTVLYKGVDKVIQKGELRSKLSSEQVESLAILLRNNLKEPPLFRRVRDVPITTLRSDGREFIYHATKIDGPLKEVNSKIEDLVRLVNTNKQTR